MNLSSSSKCHGRRRIRNVHRTSKLLTTKGNVIGSHWGSEMKRQVAKNTLFAGKQYRNLLDQPHVLVFAIQTPVAQDFPI